MSRLFVCGMIKRLEEQGGGRNGAVVGTERASRCPARSLRVRCRPVRLDRGIHRPQGRHVVRRRPAHRRTRPRRPQRRRLSVALRGSTRPPCRRQARGWKQVAGPGHRPWLEPRAGMFLWCRLPDDSRCSRHRPNRPLGPTWPGPRRNKRGAADQDHPRRDSCLLQRLQTSADCCRRCSPTERRTTWQWCRRQGGLFEISSSQ